MRMKKTVETLFAAQFDSPLGPLLAIADEQALHLVEFIDQRDKKNLRASIVSGRCPPLLSIEKELELYFSGSLHTFKTPLHIQGSPFQKNVWDELRKIPYGETISYAEQAASMGKPTAYRAVAQANGANRFTIVIPCHRVINTGGKLGGYGGGLNRKEWLLEHERKHAQDHA